MSYDSKGVRSVTQGRASSAEEMCIRDRHVERVSAEHTGGVDVLDRHLGGVELVLPPVRMAPVVIVVSVHPSDFVLLGLALHGLSLIHI